MIVWFKTLGGAIRDEFVFILRQKSLLFVLLAIPIVYPVIISSLYMQNTAVKRPAIIVDDDNSAYSRKLTYYLGAAQGIDVISRLSSVEEGFELMKSGRSELFVYIPQGFSRKLKKGDQSEIKLWINTSNMLVYSASYPGVVGAVSKLNETLGQKAFMQKGVQSKAAALKVFPINRDERLLYSPHIAYAAFMVPGIMIIVLQQLILLGMAFSVGWSRQLGQFALDKRFPFLSMEGRFIAQSLFYLIGVVFMICVVFPFFGWPIKSKLTGIILFALFAITMSSPSILVAMFFKDKISAFQLLMFVSTPIYLASGYTWPFEDMPGYVRAFAAIFPATPAAQALRYLSDKSPDLQLVAPYLKWMAVQFAVYTLMAVIVIRKSWRKAYVLFAK